MLIGKCKHGCDHVCFLNQESVFQTTAWMTSRSRSSFWKMLLRSSCPVRSHHWSVSHIQITQGLSCFYMFYLNLNQCMCACVEGQRLFGSQRSSHGRSHLDRGLAPERHQCSLPGLCSRVCGQDPCKSPAGALLCKCEPSRNSYQPFTCALSYWHLLLCFSSYLRE